MKCSSKYCWRSNENWRGVKA